MITAYYKLQPIKMINIDGYDFLFANILEILDTITFGHAFMDEFNDDVIDNVRILANSGYLKYKETDMLYTEVTLTEPGKKLYSDIVHGNYVCKPIEEAVW